MIEYQPSPQDVKQLGVSVSLDSVHLSLLFSSATTAWTNCHICPQSAAEKDFSKQPHTSR